MEKVPPLLYVPSKRPLRSVGDVIGKLPVPTLVDPVNPMHRVPALHWRTWVRLAFVEAGSDWRSLNKLAVQDGHLRDFLIVPSAPGSLSSGRDVVADPRVASTREGSGFMGVRRWEQPCGTVQGESRPSIGAFSIADPRVAQSAKWNQGQHYGVHAWGDACGAVTGQQWPNQGRFSVADPRVIDSDFHGFKVVQWNRSAGTVTRARAPGSSAQAVADPRHLGPPKHSDEFRVAPWGSAGAAVTGAQGSSQCVADPRAMASDFTVADPRSGMASDRSAYLTAGHYGVVPWDQPTGAVSAAACHDNGRWSVADPRAAGTLGAMARALPASDEKVAARILSLDGTWHRPFSTLELAALQSLFDPDDPEEAKAFGLDGSSDSAWRERIGNAVPPDAAQSMASEMGRTLLLAWSGETFTLSNADIWVRPFATALSLAQVAP